MKKILIFFILCIFFLSLVSAKIDSNYYIYDNKVLVRYSFDSISNLELKIPYDVKEEDLKVNVNYSLESLEGFSILKIQESENVSISYLTSSMIDKSKGGYYFTAIADLNDSQNVKLTLPEKAILVKQGIVSPKASSITSDGRSIILIWENFDSNQIVVKYEFVKNNSWIGYLLLLILVLGLISYSLIQRKSFKKKLLKSSKKSKTSSKNKKRALTKNLFEDEKRIVEYLLDKKGKEAWTKEIFKDLNITKVKLSRKLRSLEQKEIIKKIPYGNENKIRLILKK